jgi:aerobic carbon-monoxide dehydrogenase large subunit
VTRLRVQAQSAERDVRPVTTRIKDLLTGSACFVGDVALPTVAEATVIRSYEAHGLIRGIRTETARAVPGVLAVLTASDLEAVPSIPIRAFGYPGMELRLQPVLAHERVRYVGEPVAVVVAENRYVAEDAAALVELEFEPLPPVVDVSDIGAGNIYDSPLDNVLCRYEGSLGNVSQAFADAATVVRSDFCTQRHTGVPIETRGIVARWEGDGTLDLWGATKFLEFTRRSIAYWFALDPEAVRCHHVDVGGMFGIRGELYPEDFLIPWAARFVERPIRWIEDRREHMLSTNQGREVSYTFEMAVDKQGSFLGFRSRAAVDMGAYPRPAGGRVPILVVEELPGPYFWPVFEFSCSGVATNKTPVGTVRAPSALESSFVRERAIDIAAGRLHMDPIEIRRRNLLRDNVAFTRHFGPQIHPQHLEPAEYSGMYSRFLDAAGLESARENIHRRRSNGETVGLGVALFLAHSGLGQDEHVRVVLGQDGALQVHTTANEIGQGLTSMVQQVAASVFPFAPDDVSVRSGTTVDVPHGRGTFSSRSVIFVGNATLDACQRLLAEARTKASKGLGVSDEGLVLVKDGFRHGDDLISWRELAPISANGVHRSSEPVFGFGCMMAQMRLDAETDVICVERLAVGYDAGRVVDRQSVLAQLVGGAVQGLGATLLEEITYDSNGQPLATTFMDYLLPTSAEAPLVDAFIIGRPSEANPLGVRGAGEAGVPGAAAAIANAAADAAGDRGDGFTMLPLDPGSLFNRRNDVGRRMGHHDH